MTLQEAEEKLENMDFLDIVKSYCNKVNYIEQLKKLEQQVIILRRMIPLQREYIQFLTARLDESESALNTQSWWNGWKDEIIEEGKTYKALIKQYE